MCDISGVTYINETPIRNLSSSRALPYPNIWVISVVTYINETPIIVTQFKSNTLSQYMGYISELYQCCMVKVVVRKAWGSRAGQYR